MLVLRFHRLRSYFFTPLQPHRFGRPGPGFDSKHELGTEKEVAGQTAGNACQCCLSWMSPEVSELGTQGHAHGPTNESAQRAACAEKQVLMQRRAAAGIRKGQPAIEIEIPGHGNENCHGPGHGQEHAKVQKETEDAKVNDCARTANRGELDRPGQMASLIFKPSLEMS